jgi:hypothetical protein|tara:strand:- start:1312 stop:5187 length:3876 start_codon:yes stop_codon:yes gene_type:complete
MKSFHSLLSVSYNWIRLIPSINRKGKVVLLLIGSLLFVSESSFGQVTASNGQYFSNITVTSCGGNVWKVKAYQSNQWSQGRLNIRYNGTLIGKSCWNCSYWSTNQQTPSNNNGSWAIGGHAGRWVYVKVESGPQKAYAYFSDFTCSSCSAPSAGSIGNAHTICSGGDPSTISNSSTGSANVYQWQYSNNNSSWVTISGATSSTYNPPSGLTANRWYKRRGRKSCSSTLWSGFTSPVKVTVISAPSTGSIGNAHTICSGGDPSTISNSSTGGSTIFQWQYSNNNSSWSTISGATSSTYNPPSGLTANRWYKRRGRKNCSPTSWSGWTSPLKVTVDAASSLGTVSNSGPVNFCSSAGNFGTAVTVSGQTGSVVWNWGSNNGAWSGTWVSGNSSGVNTFPKQVSSSDGTPDRIRYKVTNGSCATVTSNAILIRNSHNVAPSSITSSINNTCGSTSGTLTATFPNAVNMRGVVEFATSLNGSAFATKSVSAGQTVFTTSVTPSSTTTYYVRYSGISDGGGSCYSSSQNVTVNVSSAPTILGTTSNSSCGTGTVVLAASSSAGTINWYAESSGGPSLETGTSFTTPSLSSTTTYYVDATSGGCTTGSRTAVTATINTVPSISGTTPDSRCNSGTVSLGTSSSAGTINWYAESSGGPSLATGTSFTTPSISSTTTYYVDATSGGCTTGSRTAITATVNTSSAGPGGVTDELMVWLKADDAALGSTWQDHSCNGFDYTKVTGPTMVTNCWNDNPAIEILSGGFDAPSGAELGNNWTVFFVAALKPSDSNGRLIEGHSGNYLLGFHGGYRNSIYWNGTAAEYNSGIATTNNVTDPHIYSYVRDHSNNSIKAKIDGDVLKTFTSTNSGSGIRLDINQGQFKSESSDSRIGEFIIFDKKLSDVEIGKVESYLASKYGLTVSNNDGGTGGDYVSTGGTTYWDASASSGYHNDVIVIGKDNSTLSNQKQSKSKDDSLKIFMSTLAADNSSNSGTISNDEAFIAIGHNGGKQHASDAVSSEKPSGITSRIEREWKITNTNFTNAFSIEVEWDISSSVDLSDLRLLVDDDGDFSNASSYSTADGLTFSFGSIIIGGIGTGIIGSGQSKFVTIGSMDAGTTLPVQLVSFEAEVLNEWNLLTWETASEINNDHFILEKSNDGVNWDELTRVEGAGNSATSIGYSYLDKQGCTSGCYYRLIQVDFDGVSETFKLITVNFDYPQDIFKLEVFPNPTFDVANLNLVVPNDGIVSLQVYNNKSEVVYSAKVAAIKGGNEFNINMLSFNSGIYYFVIQTQSSKTITVPVVKN